jgi:hypothetical protein
MITKRESKLSVIMIVVQVLITLILFLATESIFPHRIFSLNEKILLLFQIAVIWSVIMSKLRLGVVYRANSFLSLIQGYLLSIGFGTSLMLVEVTLYPPLRHFYSIDYILLFSVIDFVALIIFKLVFYYTMRYLRKKGYNSRNSGSIHGTVSNIIFSKRGIIPAF